MVIMKLEFESIVRHMLPEVVANLNREGFVVGDEELLVADMVNALIMKGNVRYIPEEVPKPEPLEPPPADADWRDHVAHACKRLGRV